MAKRGREAGVIVEEKITHRRPAALDQGECPARGDGSWNWLIGSVRFHIGLGTNKLFFDGVKEILINDILYSLKVYGGGYRKIDRVSAQFGLKFWLSPVPVKAGLSELFIGGISRNRQSIQHSFIQEKFGFSRWVSLPGETACCGCCNAVDKSCLVDGKPACGSATPA
jgi:hypothetical protein